MNVEFNRERIFIITRLIDDSFNNENKNFIVNLILYKKELNLILKEKVTNDEKLLIKTYLRAFSIMENFSFEFFIKSTSKENDDWDYRTFIASVMLKTNFYEGYNYDYIASTHIGEYMTAGFGSCNDIGDFIFPLPFNVNGEQYVNNSIVNKYYTLYTMHRIKTFT
jgi:hypothetical protein